MRRIAILLVLFCLPTLPSAANLEETVAQCVTRYGKPASYAEATDKTPFGTITFAAAGYALTVFIFNDKEVGARVSKLDKSAFTDAELQTILAADSGGSQWTPKPSDDPSCLEWSRSDKATALYDKAKHMIIFTSEEMLRAMPAPTEKPHPGN